MDELVQYAEMLINFIESRGQNYNVETQRALAEFLREILEIISENQNPVETLPAAVPQLDQGPFPSSNVNSFKYNPQTEELFVKFHGKDEADAGPIYSYQGVPKNIYDLFSQGRVAPKTSGQNRYHRWIKGVTPSLGASLYALIRGGGYGYSRVA